MKSKLLFACFVLGGWLSCSSEPSGAILVTEVVPGTWSEARPADLYYENTDTLGRKNLEVLVRFRNDYAFDRLDFVVETLSPDSLLWRDTLSVPYRDEKITEAVSLTYTDVKTGYRLQSRLNRTGKYRFRFTPVAQGSFGEKMVGVGIEITTH